MSNVLEVSGGFAEMGLQVRQLTWGGQFSSLTRGRTEGLKATNFQAVNCLGEVFLIAVHSSLFFF